MAEKVYPFNASKKLYQVNGEWVKASCGGNNILDQWDGKKENECWMIDNVEEEKIRKQELRKLYIFSTCRVQAVVSSFTGGDIYDPFMSKSGMECNSGVVDNTNGYQGLYLEKDNINTIHLDPVVPQGTDYLGEVKQVFSPLYIEATKYVTNKFDEYVKKYPMIDTTFLKSGFDVECKDPDDGYYYHIGAGCFSEPSLVLSK